MTHVPTTLTDADGNSVISVVHHSLSLPLCSVERFFKTTQAKLSV